MKRRTRLGNLVTTCLIFLAVLHSGTSAEGKMPQGRSASGPFAETPADYPIRVRKNVKHLTPPERREYVEAVLALKSVPSPYDAELSYYDQFVVWHLSLYPCSMGHEMGRAHGGPMFLPWHRHFLLLFENALREVSRKPITVPYWDWTDPASTAAVFTDDLMGGDGDPDEGYAVTTGPFAKGNWELNVHPTGLQWSASATTYLTRRFGSVPGFSSLPTPQDVDFVLERPTYDVPPYDTTSDPNNSFRNAIEGFWQNVAGTRIASGSMTCGPDGVMMTTTGPGVHNLVHAWVGGLIDVTPGGIKLGTMALPTSPNDPVFFLHHSNIDRLWAEWQETHGVDSYEPDSCDEGSGDLGCSGNTEADHMHPFEVTPADVADIRDLGYSYESLGAHRGDGESGGSLIRRIRSDPWLPTSSRGSGTAS